MTAAPLPPRTRLSLGIVGHRESNAAFAANRDRIGAVLDQLFDIIAATVASVVPLFGRETLAPVRLHSMLVDGVDQIAAESALTRGWELVAPLPFGQALNLAINALPGTGDEARALLTGDNAGDALVMHRVGMIRRLSAQAHVFELADADDALTRFFLAMLDSPGDLTAAQNFSAHSSERVALAARVMIEQSDLIIAVWDGVARTFAGGTGHTIVAALETGTPVVWINANEPDKWRILQAPEALHLLDQPVDEERVALLATLVKAVLRPSGGDVHAPGILEGLEWHDRSNPMFHAYRRIEALFGGEPRPFRSLRNRYELPEAIGTGSAAGLLAEMSSLPDGDPGLADRIKTCVLQRFAWADGISTHFSDLYRGGMVANFLVSGMAIASGVAYLPFATSDGKWIFAFVEFALLASILLVTALGQRWGWHARWFETRRVAEYLRHGPILLALGVVRAPGRWPRGTDTSWPEWYARQSLREIGLPRLAMSRAYLRMVLERLLDRHMVQQRDYHAAKARRLTSVHHNLDRLSQLLFLLAVISVASYLALKAGATLALMPDAIPHVTSKVFTFMGVLFPTFGAAIAGVRYFGDFERFAAISEVTAEKLDALHQRVRILLDAPPSALDYESVTDLAHAADDIVVAEIENWQAVFAGKHITVPV